MLILLTADNIMLFQVAANSQTKPTNLVLSPPIGCYLPHLPSPLIIIITHPYIRLHPLNGPLSGTSEVSRYQKGKTNLDFTGARDSGWQWHQLGHMQVCTSLQTDNHASTPRSHHSVFYGPDALPAAQPTASKHWRHYYYPSTLTIFVWHR